VSHVPYHDGTMARETTIADFVTDFVTAMADGGMPGEVPDSTTSNSGSSSSADYLFEALAPNHPLHEPLSAHLPGFVSDAIGTEWRDERKVQLAVGPPGTGAPPHLHKAAVNSLVFGRKRWYLMPPRDAVYGAQPIAQWVEEGWPERHRSAGRKVLECEQNAGDLLYIPDFWGHAVLNLEPSVAIASEIHTPRMQFMFRG